MFRTEGKRIGRYRLHPFVSHLFITDHESVIHSFYQLGRNVELRRRWIIIDCDAWWNARWVMARDFHRAFGKYSPTCGHVATTNRCGFASRAIG